MACEFHHDDRIVCWATHTETMADLGVVRGGGGHLMAFAVSAVPAFVAADPAPVPSEFVPTHRHYKGGLYSVLGVARAMHSGDDLVIYRGADHRAWARPKEMFEGTLDDGRRRFVPL